MLRRNLLVLLAASAALAACAKSGAPTPSTAALAPAPAPAAEQQMPAMQAPATLQEWAHGAMLFDGLGSFHRTIRTRSKEVQQYFDQGMGIQSR